MKLTHWTTLLAILAILGFATACEEEAETETTETPTTETPPEGEAPPADEPVAEDEPAAAAGGSACERARECCNAYVAAMPGGAITAEQACAGIDAATQAGGAAADTSCNTMISGWRTSLEQMNTDVPAACAAN